MKDETARELVRKMADDELPIPSWNRVNMRASFENQIATRRTPFNRLLWVELAVYAGVGITLAAIAMWAALELAA